MKNVNMPKFANGDDTAYEIFTNSILIAEDGESPDDILETIDARLKQYGLEILNYKRDDGLYMFDIIDNRAASSAA